MSIATQLELRQLTEESIQSGVTPPPGHAGGCARVFVDITSHNNLNISAHYQLIVSQDNV